MRFDRHIRFLLPLFLLAAAAASETALDRYVRAPDAHYRYQLVEQSAHAGYTSFLLEMVSQQWRGDSEVDRSIWKHWVRIYKPDAVKTSTGLLFITAGSSGDAKPEPDGMLAGIATATHSVVTELRNVPNQPLTFTGDPYGPRTEDQIIAYTWRKFLNGGDENWPLRLPMTKAAVRAMDTATAFAASAAGGGIKVDRFVVSGASKRGWTTWAAAAVDRRVTAIIPLVIDVLNVVPSFRHHYGVYGFWAPAVKDYADMRLMDDLDSPGYEKLMAIEDPFSYRERLTMPKFIINASGDQFFLPDSSKFYFDQLPGEKYLLYEANADHSLKGTRAAESLTAFYQSIIDGSARPRFQWNLASDGAFRVTTMAKPLTVKLWQATNPAHRDFRLETIGPAYRARALKASEPGVYVARLRRPAKGWTASFVELTFSSGGRHPFRFTTPVQVLPDVEPYTLPGRTAAK